MTSTSILMGNAYEFVVAHPHGASPYTYTFDGNVQYARYPESGKNLAKHPAFIIPFGSGSIALDFRAIPALVASIFGKETRTQKRARKEFVATYKDWSTEQFRILIEGITERDWIGNCTNPTKIFEQYHLYQFYAFLSLIREIPGCYQHVFNIRKRLKNDKAFAKHMNTLPGLKSGEFRKIIDSFIAQLEAELERGAQQQRMRMQQEHAQELVRCQEAIRKNVENDRIGLANYKDSQYPLHDFIPIRAQALEKYSAATMVWSEQTYTLSISAQSLLKQKGYRCAEYTTTYGMQLQHATHQECIDVLERLTTYQTHACKQTAHILVDFVQAGRIHNQAGYVSKAYVFLDVCWTVLDCCSAVGEGAVDGGIAIIQSAMHPARTIKNIGGSVAIAAHCIGKGLAFYGEIFIGHDADRLVAMCDKFNGVYNGLINYVKQHPRDAIKHASSFITQTMLMHAGTKALHSLFDQAALQLPEYMNRINTGMPPLSPQAVGVSTVTAALATQAASITVHAQKIADGVSTMSGIVSGMGPYVPLAQHLSELDHSFDYDAHNVVQYEKLKQDLKIEEFTSIIDVTEHGIMRLLERGIKAEDLSAALTKPDYLKVQYDGLNVYIKQIKNDKYNVFIVNPDTKKLVTTMPGMDKKALNNLGKNYGWDI